ncbi:hypothetical protein [Clostridium botulinum]|uniref:hypothetical protein n=1 Tax=Clostridium botulinum TaxID=1491 RepID=UPI001E347018|nr:hypothetical protein [Clostridium botulinum]MCD3223789.1 hypothetical protein [Clostridium botulinum C/D]MCD3295311.1 hypothetical protein [Clostridium botulinum C/D]
MNLVKARRDILRAWRKFGTNKIDINRKVTDKYDEVTTSIHIVNIEGIYTKGKNLISIKYEQSASVNQNYNEMFSVILNDKSKQIIRLDYFIFNEVVYKIVDIENVENIYLNFTLERI